MLIGLMDEPAVVTLRIAVPAFVSEPLVPVTVKVELPVVVPVIIERVEVVELPAIMMGFSERDHVAPAGKPVAAKLTLPVNPLRAATVTVYVAVPPGATDVVPGETLTLKSGATTLSVVVAECTSEPLVPVTETFELLAALAGAVATFRVELPDPVIDEDGEKVGVAPEGNPLGVKVTVPVNPFSGATLTV